MTTVRRMKPSLWSILATSTTLTFAFPSGAQSEDAAAAKATFDGVNKHLDLGGQLYAYLNVKGDFDSLAGKVQELYQEVLKMSEGNAPIPPNLDIPKLLQEIGLHNVDALGMSSIKHEKGYRNRAFVAVNGERTGILKLTGGPARPFQIGAFAPATADLAFEAEIDLGGLKEALQGIGNQLEAVMGVNLIEPNLDQPLGEFPMTVREVVDGLKGTAMAYAIINDTQRLQLPDDITFPAIDFVISHDRGRPFFDAFGKVLAENAPPEAIQRETVDGVSRIIISPPPQAAMGFFKPVLQVTEGSDQLLFASRAEALTTLTEGDRLASDATFQKYQAKLPKEGNGFSYTSEDLYKLIESVLEIVEREEPQLADVQREIFDAFYGAPQNMASMWANLPEGVYSETYAPMSYKLTIVYAAIVPMAVVGAVSTPMIHQLR